MTDLLERLLGHDVWTTTQLLDHATAISHAQWCQQFEMGLGSLQATFVHMIGASSRWADRIVDREVTDVEFPVDPSPNDLLPIHNHASRMLVTACHAVQDGNRLNEMMSFTADEQTWNFTRGSAIIHVVTHSMHHRAQLFNMFRHVGALPKIDGDTIEWEILCDGDQVEP